MTAGFSENTYFMIMNGQGVTDLKDNVHNLARR